MYVNYETALCTYMGVHKFGDTNKVVSKYIHLFGVSFDPTESEEGELSFRKNERRQLSFWTRRMVVNKP